MLIKYIIFYLLLSMVGTNAGVVESHISSVVESHISSLEDVLEDVYDGVSAFHITKKEEEEMKQSGNAPIYGELTPKGILLVANYMMERLQTFFDDKPPKKLIFMDVGSGAGKVPFGACIESPFSKCIGVEYSKERHAIAVNAHKKISSKWASLSTKSCEVLFINDDALKVDMRGVHALYVSSYSFTKLFMKKLLKKFQKELPDGAIIISSQELPTTPKSRLKLIRIFTLPQTWKADSKAVAYQVGIKGIIKIKNDVPPNWRPNYK